MEIKLKENSNLIIKNHNGDTLCSVDEATGEVVGGGTKLYVHDFIDNEIETVLSIITPISVPIKEDLLEILSEYDSFTNIIIKMLSGAGQEIISGVYAFYVINNGSLQPFTIDQALVSSIAREEIHPIS